MAITPLPPSELNVGPGGGAAAAGGFGFQSQIGASFALSMLNEQPVDYALGLGDARPIGIRFETEAPVDDILIATSSGGFIAVQAKTSLELSAGPGGGLAKTVEQFVRHWRVAATDRDHGSGTVPSNQNEIGWSWR